MAGGDTSGRALIATLAAALLFGAAPDPADARARCAGKKATVVGGKGRDVIKASKRGRQVIVARGGHDRIVTRGNDDIVCAGPGDDRVSTGGNKDLVIAGSGDDVVDTGPGSDRADLGDGADVLLGGGGGESVRGGPGNDRLYGEQQDDRLFGDAGDDLLIGGQGTDVMTGGPDADFMRGDSEADDYFGEDGDDTASFATATPPGYDAGPGVAIGVAGSNGFPIVVGDGAGEKITSVENYVGTAFKDTINSPVRGLGTVDGLADAFDMCFGFAVTSCGPSPRAAGEAVAFVSTNPRDPGLVVLGGTGDDSWTIAPSGNAVTVSGTALIAGPGCSAQSGGVVCATPFTLGYALAYGSGGADQIRVQGAFSRSTIVTLDGGEGADAIRGGESGEILRAGGSMTRRPTAAWVDVLEGGGGDDVVASGDELAGVAAGDILRGGPGADQMVVDSICHLSQMSGGSGGPDIAGFAQVFEPIRLVAGEGVSQIESFEGKCPAARLADDLEVLEGGLGDDLIIGSRGRDALILGKDGDDKLIGRGGADRLRGEEGSDVMLGGPGADIIEARDGGKDAKISCGADGLRATTDGRRDPKPRGC